MSGAVVPETAAPQAMMACTWITALRTAADRDARGGSVTRPDMSLALSCHYWLINGMKIKSVITGAVHCRLKRPTMVKGWGP